MWKATLANPVWQVITDGSILTIGHFPPRHRHHVPPILLGKVSLKLAKTCPETAFLVENFTFWEINLTETFKIKSISSIFWKGRQETNLKWSILDIASWNLLKKSHSPSWRTNKYLSNIWYFIFCKFVFTAACVYIRAPDRGDQICWEENI